MDPYQVITWVPPEGGGGPQYNGHVSGWLSTGVVLALQARRRSAAIAGARLSRRSTRSASTLRWRVEGLQHLDAILRVGTPAGDGVLARPHPAGHVLLPPPRHRRDHQRELRRRVDRADHRAVRLWHGARIDVARRAEGAAAAGARHGSRQAAGFTLDGPRGPARVAQPGAVWLASATGNPVLPFHLEASSHWSAAQLGPHADPEAVQHGRAGGRRTDRRARRGVAGDASRRPDRNSNGASADSNRARSRCSERLRAPRAR